jgi:hypothetical protein
MMNLSLRDGFAMVTGGTVNRAILRIALAVFHYLDVKQGVS